MSRRNNTSLNVRGVPHQVLKQLDSLAGRTNATRNQVLRAVVGDYADGAITPKAVPPLFDPGRRGQAYGADTASLAISGLEPEVVTRFVDRARRDGWLSKNDLIVALLREAVG